MKQGEGLFDGHGDSIFGGQSRDEDPGTSKNAGRSFDAKRLCVKVLCVLAAAGDYGATSEDTADATGIDLQSISPRFGDFQNLKRFPVAPAVVLVKGGAVVKRPGRSGRARQVWVITPEGESIVRRSGPQLVLSEHAS
jgi:hypothetical protein